MHFFFKLKNISIKNLICLCILVFGIAVFPVIAQKNKSVDARIVYEKPQNERVLIGDKLKLVITVLHNLGQKYELKLDKAGLKAFEVTSDPIVQTTQDGIVARTQIEVKLIPFQTGKLPIPPLLLVNNFNEELQTPALEVDVQSLLESESAQIKDVKLIPTSPVNGWLEPALLSLLFATFGIYLTVRLLDPYINQFLLAYWGKLFSEKASTPVSSLITESLEEKAIKELEDLLESELVYKDLKAFHVKLSDIMTNYAIVRYEAEFEEYTTFELLAFFREKSVPSLVINTFDQVLGVCDMVKFAKLSLDVDSARRNVKQVIDLFNSLNYRSGVQK